jgi:MoxR-like ATPase
MQRLSELGIQPVADLGGIVRVRQVVQQVRMSEQVGDYVVDLVRATREHPALRWGASPRSANMLASAARAAAVLDGRDFVIPDDVKRLWKPLMRHRVILSPSAEVDGLGTEAVLDQVLTRVPAPR